jgi:hypothetical protein
MNTKGIIEELQSSIDEAKSGKADLNIIGLRLKGSKQAIQVMALSLDYAKFKKVRTAKLPVVSLGV